MDEDQTANAYFSTDGGPTSLESSYSQYLEDGPVSEELVRGLEDQDLSLPDDGEEKVLEEMNDGLWIVTVDGEEKYLIVEGEKELKVYRHQD